MKSALMVAEKPSLAASLAKILSNGKNSTRKGFNNACSVHEWKGNFKGEGCNFRMTSVCGHVMALDFIGKYNNWDKVDPVELFSCQTEKKEASEKLRMPAFLNQEARGCQYLILWLDCDKEGENICFEVMKAVSQTIQNVYSNKVTYRAKFSAITERDIKHAMDNLISPNENESKSVDARQEIDLRCGCAFTRYQTKYFQGHYGDLDSSLISYGPCQTPTLGFCVQRSDEIANFVAETYYVLQVTVGNPDVILDWTRGRVFNRDIANMFLNMLKKYKEANVESVVVEDKTRQRPQALNTVELMRAASSRLNIGPHNAMQIAERLYTQGYISYPRTETTKYPENFDLLGVVRTLQSSAEFGPSAKIVLNDFVRPNKGTDVGDHPPITPMQLATKADLDGDTWRIYNYICLYFLATLAKDLKYKQTTAHITIGNEFFTNTTNILIDPGWTSIMTWQAFDANQLTQPFSRGDSIKINDMKIVERQTGPPDYLTESELITLMEKHGIGTDASIPVHINNICQRNYVTIASGRKLIPSTLGKVLVHGYQKIDPELVLPTMRSEVERHLNFIAKGTADFESVLKHAIEIFRLKYEYFVRNIENMDTLFESNFAPISESGRSYSRCGKCRRYMKYIQTKPVRLHCVQCDETYSLPANGTIRVYKELRCPLDDFELLAFSGGTQGKAYPLCPYCYNNSPFPDMMKMSGCNSCTHPTCANSMMTLGVSQCTECKRGVMVLDVTSAPKKWKLGCNTCDVIINIFKGATKVSVDLNATCDECSAQLVTAMYRAEDTKFKDGSAEKTGCLFCTEEFLKFVEKSRAVTARPVQKPRGGGAAARGNGRGGGALTAYNAQSNRGGPAVGGGRGGRGRPPRDKMAELAAYFV